MRYLFSSILCFVLLATACKKTNPTITTLDGAYTGTFQRQQGSGGLISQVSLTFSGNNWSGSSQYPKYPALCRGTYTISAGNKISFANACAWTTEFDWSLILGREYNLSVDGNAVVFAKDDDIYKLSK
jgi:hypothetical protein